MNHFIGIASVVLFLLIGSACKLRNGSSEMRVLNGSAESEFPYVVQLTINGKGKCTGSFVSPSLMITAAHCLQHAKYVEYDGVRVDRDQFFIHPDWPTGGEACQKRPNPPYDVALIRFPDKTYSGSEFAKLAPAAPAAGETIKIVGFGHNEIKVFSTYCRLDSYGDEPEQGCVLRKATLSRGIDYDFEVLFTYPWQLAVADSESVGCPIKCTIDGLTEALAAASRDWPTMLQQECAGNFRDRPYEEAGAGTKRSGINKLAYAGRGIFKFYGQLDQEGVPDSEVEVASGAGDSGGPLFSHSGDEWFLAGVTHGGGLVLSGDGVEKASVYVNLNSVAVRPWLEAVIRKEGLSFPPLTP